MSSPGNPKPKTINELLAEFNQPPYTVEEWKQDRAEIEALYLQRGIKPEEIAPKIRAFEIQEDELFERWVESEQFRSVMDGV